MAFHSTNLNGPVPTGWNAMSLLPHCFSAAGLIITVDGCASCAMNGENGVFSVIRAV